MFFADIYDSVTFISMFRLRFLVVFTSGINPTWDQTDVVNWSNIEICVGILCGCMPTMRVMLTRAFPRILDSTKRHSQSGSREDSPCKLHELDDEPEHSIDLDQDMVEQDAGPLKI